MTDESRKPNEIAKLLARIGADAEQVAAGLRAAGRDLAAQPIAAPALAAEQDIEQRGKNDVLSMLQLLVDEMKLRGLMAKSETGSSG